MGMDNLNRVFIKAYGKGGTGQSAGKETVAEQEPLMVRFDTATVQIPAPHTLASRHLARSVAAPTSVAPQTQSIAQPTASETAHIQAESELTQWDERMMSILFGGATMVTPNSSLSAARRRVPSAQPSSTEPGIHGTQPESTTSQSRGQSSNQVNNWPNVKMDTNGSQSDFAPRVTAAQTVVAGSQSSKPGSTQSALTEVDKSGAELAQRIAAMNRVGEIFRLDRPSYAASNDGTSKPEGVPEGNQAEDSSQTALDLELQQAMTGTSTTTKASSKMSASASTDAPHLETLGSARSRSNDRSKRREQNLRQARNKIFNPLWEVDCLEWPAVCAELSRTIDQGSAGVIENLLRACQAGLQVMAVTSPQSGEGTSTVACCLAMLAGKHGLNIVLVDGNIENPSLSYQTNLDLEVDWNDAVSKRLPLEEIAVRSVDDQVTLVPLLERLNAPELNEQNMAMMLQELSQSFDLVIVDLGNMSSQRNLVRKLGELGVLNAVVAVVDRRLSSPERIEMCLRQIRQTGIASIGLVENFAALSSGFVDTPRTR